MAKNHSYQSGSGISIRYNVEDALPDFYNAYPEITLETLRQTAQNALEATTNMTPMKTGELRNNRQVTVYQNGRLGGSIYVGWWATNDRGQHYAQYQEAGVGYTHYTTPGTGPGFMEATYNIIGENAMKDVTEATQNLFREVSV